MKNLSILSFSDNSADFERQFRKVEMQKHCPAFIEFVLESEYRKEEIGKGSNFADLSFLLLHLDQPIALVCAHKCHDFIGYAGSGVCIYPLHDTITKKHTQAIITTLIEYAALEGVGILKMRDEHSHKILSETGQYAYGLKGRPYVRLQLLQDLTQSEESLHKDLRKSYKSLINQGNKELDFTVVNSDNADRMLFQAFQDFHKVVAGRQTRSQASWDVQWDMIEEGSAELVLGYMKPYGLVSSAFFTDFGSVTSYAVAVYNRDLFAEKPLGHASVYNAMLRAKERGQETFNLGIIPTYEKDLEKPYNIGKFKKGFCRDVHSFIEWHIPVN